MSIAKHKTGRNMIDATLVGGPLDGETIRVWTGQPCEYIRKRLLWEEHQALAIPAHGNIPDQSFKAPELVYDRADNVTYKYRHTVHYKPRDEGQIEIEKERLKWNKHR